MAEVNNPLTLFKYEKLRKITLLSPRQVAYFLIYTRRTIPSLSEKELERLAFRDIPLQRVNETLQDMRKNTYRHGIRTNPFKNPVGSNAGVMSNTL